MTSLLRPISLTQVLLFGSRANVLEYGRAVWAAVEEIERFYRRADLISKCLRFAFDPDRSPPLQTEWSAFEGAARQGEGMWQSLLSYLPRTREAGDLLPAREFDRSASATKRAASQARSQFWQKAQGTYSRTFSQDGLYAAAREAVAEQGIGGSLVVFTDQEITPPEGYRYLLWQALPEGIIVSTAPMDPRFWGEARPDGAAIIKQRVRAAGIHVVGELLGLGWCQNPACYLYGSVDSVTALDSMVLLGDEHGRLPMTDRGFSPRSQSPDRVQEIIDGPSPEEGLVS